MTVEGQTSTEMIMKASCKCGQNYGLVYKLDKVVKFKKE